MTPESYFRLTKSDNDILLVRWSVGGEFLERIAPFGAEASFLHREEIAFFFEGFGARSDAIDFRLVVFLLNEFVDFPGFHRSPRGLRNAGAFAAEFCRDFSRSLYAPSVTQLIMHLRRPPIDASVTRFSTNESPEIEDRSKLIANFRQFYMTRSTEFERDEIRHWFEHGRGPIGSAGEDVADRIEPIAERTIETIVESLIRRPRSAAAARWIPQLEGSLALPPRRLEPATLPIGGYADVSTRGEPERILPFQFALEPIEFLRRFAERELLYYHREEPKSPTPRDLVLVIDQGVRTWGDVRLIIIAAAIALAKRDVERRKNLLVAATSSGGLIVDPAEVDDEELGELFDASDLSPDPAEALARVLKDRSRIESDIVLFTHRLSLIEPAVVAAARGIAAGSRLFSVGVDGDGVVELGTMIDGRSIAIGKSRVEFEPDPPPKSITSLDSDLRIDPWNWIGDVESLPYPFALGLEGPIDVDMIAFDYDGRSLIVADYEGMIQRRRLDGSFLGVIPALPEYRSLVQPRRILPLPNGLAVFTSSKNMIKPRFAYSYSLLYYNFMNSYMRCYKMEESRMVHSFYYDPRRNSIVLVDDPESRTRTAISVELLDSPRTPVDLKVDGRLDASRIVSEPNDPDPFSDYVYLYKDTNKNSESPSSRTDRSPRLSIIDGRTTYFDVAGYSWTYAPTRDGIASHLGASIRSAKLGESMIAIEYRTRSDQTEIHVLNRRRGEPIATFDLGDNKKGRSVVYAISREGNFLAYQDQNENVIRLLDLSTRTESTLKILTGRPERTPNVSASKYGMIIVIKDCIFVLDWKSGVLEISRSRNNEPFPPGRDLASRGRSSKPLTQVAPNARGRMIASIEAGTSIWLDRYGQIFIRNACGKVVCAFFMIRDELCGMTPEGARFGPSDVVGGEETPRAFAEFGAALTEAFQYYLNYT
jgi:hypothetical protein